MASAHYFFRNYDIKTVLNLMCYMTEYPHTLTSGQKITRLYRCFLRREKEWHLHESRADPLDYHRNIQIAREKLEPLLNLPENSAAFGQTLKYFEDRLRENMDPTMIINDSRQYSANNGRSYVWSDEELKRDPFGYYSGRMIGHRKPGEGFLYYPDFPMDGQIWHMDPPTEYDDAVDEDSYKQ